MNLKLNLGKKGGKLHGKLDEGLDTLKAIKNHLESFESDDEDSITMQLKMARASFLSKKQEAEDAMIKLVKLVEDQKEESDEVVAQWKVRRFQNKLEKRAERAEECADALVTLALYYTGKAEVAVLEAIAARQDANLILVIKKDSNVNSSNGSGERSTE